LTITATIITIIIIIIVVIIIIIIISILMIMVMVMVIVIIILYNYLSALRTCVAWKSRGHDFRWCEVNIDTKRQPSARVGEVERAQPPSF